MAARQTLRVTPQLLSDQVSGSRYFFLNPGGHGPAGFRPALGGREHCNPDYRLDRRRYSYYVLEYVAEGAGAFELDGVSGSLGPGSVFVSWPTTHTVVATDPRQPLTKYFICVSGRGFEARLKALRFPVGRVARVAAHGEVRNVFEEIIREGRQSGEHADRICALLLDVLLLKIADGVSHPARPAQGARENFLRCKALADAQADRLHSLEDLAGAAGLEASTVCRLFRRFQGTSPYQYLLRTKMNQAAEHLLGTGMLVKEAAQRVGFSDPYHFSRCFKAVHGLAPRDLRRSG